MKVDWAQVGAILGEVAGVTAAVYGAVKGYTDGRNIVGDWLESRQDPSGFKVRATISKTVIHADRTEYIRLRTIRARKKVASLRIDHWPIIVPENGKERKAALSNYYAMPGRAVELDEMFQINLLEDEALQAHRDHSVVLGYMLEEGRDVLFTPPGVSIVPPVGSDYAVIEVHFPGCQLAVDVKHKPQIRFYARHSTTKKETDFQWPSKDVTVTSPEYDLNWIRARVNNPPQDSEICLDWQWQ